MNKSGFFGAVVAAALFAGNVPAGEIDGVVRDADGFPVRDAVVRVVELDREASSDAHGHFHFEDVAPGVYTIEVDDGASTVSRPVEVGDGVASVGLRVGSASLGSIVVHASPMMSRSPLEMARPVTVLGGDDLARKSAASIGETVAAELGVSATSFGQGASRPVIRGLGDDRVRVLQGGIGTLDVSTVSDDHGVTIEPVLVDQVEVLRGPATLLYGTGAIGGVVNVVDNRIPERMPSHGVEGRAELRGASVNGERTGVLRLDGRFGDGVAWHVDAYDRTTDDYDSPAGTIPNSDVNHRGAAAGASRITGRGFVGMSASVMDNAYGLPAAEGPDEEIVRIDQEQTRFDAAGSLAEPIAGIGQLRFRFGYNDYTHTELEDGETGTVFANKAWEGRLELTHVPIAGGWEGAAGVQSSGREFSAIGEEAFTPPVDSTETGVFWVEERDFGRVKLELGTRLERVEHDPDTGPRRAFTLKSISAGMIARMTGDVDAVFNAGRYQRAPAAEELYSDGPHLATFTFELGDPALDDETSNALEAGFRDQRGELRWSATAFRTEFDEFIFLDGTGVDDTESGLPIFLYRQQDATFTGIEAEIIAGIAEGAWGRIDARAFTDRVRARLADGSDVPRIPPRRHGLSVDYTRDDWFARLDWTHHARQDRLAPGETPTPAYDMVNLDLNRRVYTARSEWFLFVRGTNLLDEDARRHTSFLKDVAPLPGRNVLFGARVGF